MNLGILDQKQAEFGKAVEHLKSELASLRTGRANASLVDQISVDYYGTPTPLMHIAQIGIPEPRLIAIQPYDKSIMKEIEKAILQSNIGITPVNDGNFIRLTIPSMTQERRKELAKVVGQMSEKARVAVRNLREETWKEIQNLEKADQITEDDKISAKEELQELVDKFNEQIKIVADAKEKEIMTI